MYNPYGATVFGYNRRLLEFGPRQFLQNIDTFRIVGGFQGVIPEDAPVGGNFKWEVSYNYGRTTGTEKNVGNLILSRTAEALGPSFVDGNGVPTCGTPDRKSTRLNSSHLGISYAVFCSAHRSTLSLHDALPIFGGFQGVIPEDAPVGGNFKWEVSYNYGRTTGTEKNVGNLILSRTAEALGPSFVDGNGVPTCGT